MNYCGGFDSLKSFLRILMCKRWIENKQAMNLLELK